MKSIRQHVRLFCYGICPLLAVGCSPSSPEQSVVKTSYFHSYGPKLEKDAWKAEGSTGEVVEVMKNGVVLRRGYVGGVLEGPSTWSFPHSDIAQRYEEYQNGKCILSAKNYETGTPQLQEQWLSNEQRLVHAWYEDGAPRFIEEYTGDHLINGQYFSLEGEVEASVIAGTGFRVERSRSGDLLFREQFASSALVLREAFFSNGQLRESVAFQGGKRHGQSRHFLETGEPLAIENWNQGELDGVQMVFESGQPTRQTTYSMGKKEGVERRFRPGTEEVAEEIAWHQDQRHGVSKVFLADQVLTEWYWRGGRVSEGQYRSLGGGALPVG